MTASSRMTAIVSAVISARDMRVGSCSAAALRSSSSATVIFGVHGISAAVRLAWMSALREPAMAAGGGRLFGLVVSAGGRGESNSGSLRARRRLKNKRNDRRAQKRFGVLV